MTKFNEACEAVDRGELVTWKMFQLVRIESTGEYKLRGSTGDWNVPGKLQKEDEFVVGKFKFEYER